MRRFFTTLPKRIFHLATFNTEDLERFRTQQLSTPMCLILDLIFQEKLKIRETAKILKLSENVFEPFLFTVFHRLQEKFRSSVLIKRVNSSSLIGFYNLIRHTN